LQIGLSLILWRDESMLRKPIITALLACYLFYAIGCTSQRLIPIEDYPPNQNLPNGKITSIETVDGRAFKIGPRTGSVILVGDSLKVTCNSMTPYVMLSKSEVKQVTIRKFSPPKTAVLALVMVLIGVSATFLMFNALDQSSSGSM
jgi:hypothetical protein